MAKRKLKFKDTTLVSFGDSYTFGHGSTLESNLISIINSDNLAKQNPEYARKKWRQISNRNSYTKFLEKRLHFKQSHNLGLPGCSNKSIFKAIVDYSEMNSTDNVLYIINLTRPERDLIYTKNHRFDSYVPYDFIYNLWNETRKDPNENKLDIYNIKPDGLEGALQYYFNNYTIIINHIILHYALTNYLETLGVPYILVDVLNDLTVSNIRYNIVDNIVTSSDEYKNFFDDESDFSMSKSIIERYFEDLENKTIPTYLNYFSLLDYKYYLNTDVRFKKTGIVPTLDSYIRYYPTEKSILSPIKGDPHWNVYGHELFTDILEDWLLKHFEDIT